MKYMSIAVITLCATTGHPGASAADRTNEQSCGEVCAQMLCAYYNVPFDRSEALRRLRLGTFGETSLRDLQACLESSGLRCVAVSGAITSLDNVDGPMVFHVKATPRETVGHFGVVMRDRATGQLFAYDPFNSPAPTPVSAKILAKQWSGMAIVVRPPRAEHSFGVMLAVGIVGVVVGAVAAFRTGARASK